MFVTTKTRRLEGGKRVRQGIPRLRAFVSCLPDVRGYRRLCSPEITGSPEHLNRRLDEQISTPANGVNFRAFARFSRK
jgi:hypothetical protein